MPSARSAAGGLGDGPGGAPGGGQLTTRQVDPRGPNFAIDPRGTSPER